MGISVLQGDITALEVDAVVNAANEYLAHGGGVAAAMVRAGGQIVQDESDAWVREHGRLLPGTAAVTTAGEMPAEWIIHVAGPRFREGQDNAGLLRKAVRAALDASAEIGAESVALPAISAGIFGYPVDAATRVIADTTREWLRGHETSVILVGYDEATTRHFAAAVG